MIMNSNQNISGESTSSSLHHHHHPIPTTNVTSTTTTNITNSFIDTFFPDFTTEELSEFATTTMDHHHHDNTTNNNHTSMDDDHDDTTTNNNNNSTNFVSFHSNPEYDHLPFSSELDVEFSPLRDHQDLDHRQNAINVTTTTTTAAAAAAASMVPSSIITTATIQQYPMMTSVSSSVPEITSSSSMIGSQPIITSHNHTTTTMPIMAGPMVNHATTNTTISTTTTTTMTNHTNNSVPEFLYQLTKMLTEKNHEVIEWSHGRIEVHSPQKLESDVLKKYFRHSKFASFQRQLNYFGFRKLAGKGKMAPCSYVNDATLDDISSLFQIKRKSGPDPLDTSNKKKKEKDTKGNKVMTNVNPVLAGIYNRTTKQQQQQQQSSSDRTPLILSTITKRISSTHHVPNPMLSTAHVVGSNNHNNNNYNNDSSSSTTATVPNPSTSTHQELAQRAVGRGIRHNFITTPSSAPEIQPSPPISTTTSSAAATQFVAMNPLLSSTLSSANTSTANSLSELESNYQNSLRGGGGGGGSSDSISVGTDRNRIVSTFDSISEFNANHTSGCFLSRNSSLIDLAMLAPVDNNNDDEAFMSNDQNSKDDNDIGENFEFLDFPNP